MSDGWEVIGMDGLQAGMSVKEIIGLPSEYSYLDSKRVAFLRERFAGATAKVAVKGKIVSRPAEALEPGQEVKALVNLPEALGLERLDEEGVDFLKAQGFRKFRVAPFEPVEAPASDGASMGAPEGAPGKLTPKETVRRERVAECRQFLEHVERAENTREDSAKRVEDMFHEGRADRHATEPAMEAVEDILANDLAGAMTAVVGLKASDQTYAHCVDMAVIFHEATASIIAAGGQAASDKVNRSTLAAGFMHDIGKSRIPREILDSKARFAPESREMQIMRSHVDEGAKILSDASMDKAMINVAHYHHVKKDTSLITSYPDVDYAQVLPLTRLAAIVDVYQALIGRRSYKRNWVPGKAVRYLRSLEGIEFDEPMMEKFLAVIGLYPVGSMVQLSTGELAFVTRINDRPLERPVVVVAVNAEGERLSSNPLIDLSHEPEIAIDDVVDHYEYFGDDPDAAFRTFMSLNVV